MGDNGLRWTNDTRRLGDLIPWRSNPRQIKEHEAGRLLDSLVRFGQVQTIAIGPDNDIYDGHQRKYVWAAAARFGPDFEVDVRVSSRPLTERERQQLAVYLHEGATGEWNFDELANWDVEVDDLVEWGFEKWQLGVADDIIDPNELWKGMPEFEQDYGGAIRIINIYFATEEDIQAFSDMIGQSITEKTKGLWYPKRDNLIGDDFICRDES